MNDCDCDIIIVCADTAFPGIKGQWETCSRCTLEIYVSDSSLNSIKEQGYAKNAIKLLCLKCVRYTVKDPQMLKLSEEQIKEIKFHFMKGKI